MAFWWVNHKQTREHEVRGGYLWSPYRNANGAFNQTYENMRHVRVGDMVFSYAGGQIGAVGRVTAAATPSPKPVEFGTVGDYWANEGWLVEVDFIPVPSRKGNWDILLRSVPVRTPAMPSTKADQQPAVTVAASA